MKSLEFDEKELPKKQEKEADDNKSEEEEGFVFWLYEKTCIFATCFVAICVIQISY